MEPRKWYAARLPNHPDLYGAALISVLPGEPAGRFYWYAGPAWSFDQYQVLKEYSTDDYLDETGEFDFASLQVDFFREFCPALPVQPRRSCGWVSPEGDFYACLAWEHDDLARLICATRFAAIDQAVLRLEQNFFIRLLGDGTVGLGSENQRLTRRQIATLKQLAEADAGWADALWRVIAYWEGGG